MLGTGTESRGRGGRVTLLAAAAAATAAHREGPTREKCGLRGGPRGQGQLSASCDLRLILRHVRSGWPSVGRGLGTRTHAEESDGTFHAVPDGASRTSTGRNALDSAPHPHISGTSGGGAQRWGPGMSLHPCKQPGRAWRCPHCPQGPADHRVTPFSLSFVFFVWGGMSSFLTEDNGLASCQPSPSPGAALSASPDPGGPFVCPDTRAEPPSQLPAGLDGPLGPEGSTTGSVLLVSFPGLCGSAGVRGLASLRLVPLQPEPWF